MKTEKFRRASGVTLLEDTLRHASAGSLGHDPRCRRQGIVTLFYDSRDTEENGAAASKEYIEHKGAGTRTAGGHARH